MENLCVSKLPVKETLLEGPEQSLHECRQQYPISFSRWKTSSFPTEFCDSPVYFCEHHMVP